MYLTGMAVDGQRRKTRDSGDIAQVLSIGGRVDREIGFERQQYGGVDTLRQPILEHCHRGDASSGERAERRLLTITQFDTNTGPQRPWLARVAKKLRTMAMRFQ